MFATERSKLSLVKQDLVFWVSPSEVVSLFSHSPILMGNVAGIVAEEPLPL